MKKNTLVKSTHIIFTTVLTSGLLLATSCANEDPVKEDTPELITKATFVFTPVGTGTAVTVSATDPDGEGVQDIKVDGSIQLLPNTVYDLSISLINELVEPTDPEYNLTEEVEEEGDEHMFFFAWTNNAFTEPTGNGNIDSRADAVNYQDKDSNNLPLGLSTRWKTAASSTSGKFRVVLKHQPEGKSASSGFEVGETDLDIEFSLSIQ